MEQNTLTLDQALQNIRIILDAYVADKKTHIALDDSFSIVENAAKNNLIDKK